jgi:predicted membrane-bound spermidine synthase
MKRIKNTAILLFAKTKTIAKQIFAKTKKCIESIENVVTLLIILLLAKLKKSIKDTKKQIDETTTLGSFVSLLVFLALIIFFELVFEPTGLLYQVERIVCAVVLYFLIVKIRLTFLMKAGFNEKGINVLELYTEYKKDVYNLSIEERNLIVTEIIKQENSKHQKLVKREQSERIAIALIITSMFVLGVM